MKSSILKLVASSKSIALAALLSLSILDRHFLMAESNEHEDRNLVLYFLVAFAWSWFFWIPMREAFGNSFYVIGVFGPFVSAFILAYFNQGTEGVKKLLKRGVDLGFGKKMVHTYFIVVSSDRWKCCSSGDVY
jgi:hypothetical protein